MDKSPEKERTTYNVFRDSGLRYLGYANEVGESFRYQFPKFVIPSYILSFGYVCADAINSGHIAYIDAILDESRSAMLDSTVATFDTLIWQSLASVVIPGATINATVRASRFALSRAPVVVPTTLATWIPTMLGLCCIPIIIQPIDRGVDIILDSTYRQVDFHDIFDEGTR